MAGLPSWLTTGAWDTASIDGQTVPGLVKVDVARKATGLELYKPPGQAGHSVRDVGQENAKLTMTVQIWEDSQLADLERLYARLRPGPKQSARRAMAFSHPNAALLGITSVYVLALGALDIKDGLGTAKIELLEITTPRQGGVKRAGKSDPSLKGIPTAIKLPGVPPSPAKPSATEALPRSR